MYSKIRSSLLWSALCGITGSSSSSADGLLFRSFLDWLREMGASINFDLELSTDPSTGIRSLIIQEEAVEGQEIFFVPPSAMITTEQAKTQNYALQTCKNGDEESPAIHDLDATWHALFLLQQRLPGEKWEPWARLFPVSFQGMPLYYTEEDLKDFQASPVRQEIQHEQRRVMEDYVHAVGLVPNLTLNEFKWARCVVASRQFQVKWRTDGLITGESIMMVPLLDFVNYPDGELEQNVRPEYNSEGVRFFATRLIRPGETLYCYYGSKSNSFLLRRWGFTDRAMVLLSDMPLFLKLDDFEKDTALNKLKLKAITRSVQDGFIMSVPGNGIAEHHTLSGLFTGRDFEHLLGRLRFLVFGEEEVSIARHASVLHRYCPRTLCRAISASNEKRSLLRLDAILSKLSAEYETSEEEDETLLDSGLISPFNGTRWHALVILNGEKRLLRVFRQLLAIVLPLFDLAPLELKRQIRRNLGERAPHWSGIDQYIKSNVTDLVNKRSKGKISAVNVNS